MTGFPTIQIPPPPRWHGVAINGEVEIGLDCVIDPFCLLGSEHGPLTIGRGARIRSHTVIEGDVEIGERFQTGHHVLIRHGVRIGHGVKVGSYASVEGGTDLEDDVELGGRVQLGSQYPGNVRLVVGRGARLYLGTIVLDNRRPPHGDFEPATIGAGASIGAGCLILPGAIVEPGAKVPAGSVIR